MNDLLTKPEEAAIANPRGVRLATLTLIRWGAIGGQAIALLVVRFVLEFPVPLAPAFAVVGASLLLNIALVLYRPAQERVGERAAAALLAFDLVQLAALLYLTGGLENPFSFLLLAPITVSATILSWRSIALLSGLALVAITLLGVWHLPLPWGPGGLVMPPVYILGGWVALALGIAFFAAYTGRVAREARRMSQALSATQLALMREQQLSAVGGLAAAAAHELGTPLGTIALVSKELARDLPPDSPIAEDVALLSAQSERCRAILAELGHGPSQSANGDPMVELPLPALIEAAAQRHNDGRTVMRFDAAPFDGDVSEPPPMARNRPEIVHGIGNLVQNAVQYARTEVVVTTRWSDHRWQVIVLDDGPGFPPRLLDRLGEPYISLRGDDATHMGLGVFIARTLLERTGASLAFDNRPSGGASASVTWDGTMRAGETALARAGETE